MSIELNEYKRIRKGFILKICKNTDGLLTEMKFETLSDLICYIHCLSGNVWIIVANSNNRITLFGGLAYHFQDQTKKYQVLFNK